MIIQHISRIESVSYSTVVSTINFDLTTYCNCLNMHANEPFVWAGHDLETSSDLIHREIMYPVMGYIL